MPISFRDIKTYTFSSDLSGEQKQTRCTGTIIDRRYGKIVAFLFGDLCVPAMDVHIIPERKLIELRSNAQLLHQTDTADATIKKLTREHVELIHLRVTTVAGDHIGSLVDFEFEPMLYEIILYRVKPELSLRIKEWLKHLALTRHLLISRSLVVEIRPTELVIKNDVEQQKEHVQLVKARALGLDMLN